jgi:two-component system, LytTR family, response regulator
VTAPAIRALIVDDEPLGRARLRTLLARHADMQVVGECVEGGEAAGAIGRMRPDVVFLDIEMTEISGLELAAGMAGETLPAVVFVTAHERYAREAFDVRALDYLLKPFEEERFRTTLERVRGYIAAVRGRRSHEHLVAILRALSDTPVEELERLRAPEMPLPSPTSSWIPPRAMSAARACRSRSAPRSTTCSVRSSPAAAPW